MSKIIISILVVANIGLYALEQPVKKCKNIYSIANSIITNNIYKQCSKFNVKLKKEKIYLDLMNNISNQDKNEMTYVCLQKDSLGTSEKAKTEEMANGYANNYSKKFIPKSLTNDKECMVYKFMVLQDY
ncbi:MAG: hypothetical protein U9N59_01210 [Campylobacterota bacterium]|nr:hypothetical protein [Campylobacterota bacterium]